MASTEKINSTPPLAPSRWPNWLLVLETLTLWACSLKTDLMAVVSAWSPKRSAGAVGVDVADVACGSMPGVIQRQASWRGRRPTPSLSGWVMWPPSALMP